MFYLAKKLCVKAKVKIKKNSWRQVTVGKTKGFN